MTLSGKDGKTVPSAVEDCAMSLPRHEQQLELLLNKPRDATLKNRRLV